MSSPADPPRWPPLPAQPLVSVVTPSFNQGQFIGATIESVLAQDYPRIEYLVMDGGSTDGTLDLLRGYGARLRWVSARDGGQADALNRGWRRARGELLGWLNSDDCYLPGAVSAAVAALEANPHAVGVYGDCDYIDERGRVIDRHPTRPYDYAEIVRSAHMPIPQPAMFVRRAAVEAAGFVDAQLFMVMDLDLELRLGLLGPFVYLPRRMAQFRQHATSKTIAQQARAAPETLAVFRRLLARPDLPAPLRAVEREALASALIGAGNSLLLAGDLAGARRHALAGWAHAAPRARAMARKILLICAGGPPALSAYLRWRHGLKRVARAARPLLGR